MRARVSSMCGRRWQARVLAGFVVHCRYVRCAASHMQVVEHTRCSRKFIRKNAGGTKILHMSEIHDFERFGGVFGAKHSSAGVYVSAALREDSDRLSQKWAQG